MLNYILLISNNQVLTSQFITSLRYTVELNSNTFVDCHPQFLSSFLYGPFKDVLSLETKLNLLKSLDFHSEYLSLKYVHTYQQQQQD